ncbi:MAG: alkyl hydroperoxide reductase [Acidobacteriota bacterium]
MKARTWFPAVASVLLWTALVPRCAHGAAAQAASATPTFASDVARVLHENCVECHRPGEMAPMSLLTYQEARPWAKSIARVVASGAMPPWHADSRYGPYANDLRLSEDDKTLLLAWVEGGAPQGDPAELSAPPEFTRGWSQGEPDLVVTLPEPVVVDASGDDEYHYIVVPMDLDRDVWVRSAEVRPGNREIVHHATVMVMPPSLVRQGPDGPELALRTPTREALTQRVGKLTRLRSGAPVVDDGCAHADGGDFPGSRPGEGPQLGVFLPGKGPDTRPTGHAVLVPAGSFLLFQMHYSPAGERQSDQTQIGLILADAEDVEHRVKRVEIWNNLFEIPPRASRHEVTSCFTFDKTVRAISYTAHMHFRGSSMKAEALLPDGTRKTLFSVPDYSFNWQTTYVLAQPHPLPAGTVIHTTATFDNSAGNPLNPDPGATVRWGEPSDDEMMGFWIEYVDEPAAAVPNEAEGR